MTAGLDEVVVADGVVTKRHGGRDGALRAAWSAAAMHAARAAGLPVPAPVGLDGPVLRTTAVRDATAGIVALHDDPSGLLGLIGGTARRLHALSPPPALPVAAPGVWVHGDLCPANVLVDGGRMAGVIDWEDSRVDDPLVDLVWTEWLVRTHHADQVAHLPALYDGYGIAPPSGPRRRAVMRRLVERHRDREGGAATPWRRHLDALAALDLGRPASFA